jgi:hypothetical protein
MIKKTLTVTQPYAYLICAGIKPVENRSWKTNLRERALIHASSKILPVKFEIEGQASVDEIAFACAVNFVEENSLTSAIIGSVEIVDCIRHHPSVWSEKDKWNWVFANPILFDNPVRNVKGKLSFWNFDIQHDCTNIDLNIIHNTHENGEKTR